MRSHLLLVLFGTLLIGCNQTGNSSAEKSDTTADLVAQCEAAVECIKAGTPGGAGPYDYFTFELLKSDNLKYKAECVVKVEFGSGSDISQIKRLGWTGSKWEHIESFTGSKDNPKKRKDSPDSEGVKRDLKCFNK